MNMHTFQVKGSAVCSDGVSLINKYRKVIMGFAALWILLFHEWVLIFESIPFLGAIEGFVTGIGFCGVDIFFFLSAIGLYYSIRGSSVKSFYIRRGKRVFLPFLIITVIVSIVEKWSIVQFIRNVTGISFYTKNIYEFLWFFPAVLTFYGVFPWYYRIFMQQKNKHIFHLSVIGIWMCLSVLLKDTLRTDLYGFTNRIPVFLTGIYVSWLSDNGGFPMNLWTWIGSLMVLFLGLTLAYLTNFRDMYLLFPASNCCIPNFLITLSLPQIIAGSLYFISGIPIIRYLEKMITGVLSFFGLISLELYCVQERIGIRLIPYLQSFIGNSLLVNILNLSSILAAAYGMHLVIALFWKLVKYQRR